MSVSVVVKSTLAFFLYSLRFVSWKIKKNSGHRFAILTYHHIIPRRVAQQTMQPGMYVTPETFEIHLKLLHKCFKIVPLPELLFILQNNALKVSNGKPFCALTFDDGWQDFHKYAFPILKTYQIPATVFLPTDFIGTHHWFWTDRLTSLYFQRADIVISATNRASDLLINRLETIKGSRESQLESAIAILKECEDEVIDRILSELFVRWKVDPVPPSRTFLSWEEVKEMAQSGLITYGSHTAAHRILTHLKEEEVKDELVRSKEMLMAQKIIAPLFVPFSYPNGNYDEKVMRIVREAGYSLAVTTQRGWNSTGSDPYRLKRISIHEDMTSTYAMFGSRIVGFL